VEIATVAEEHVVAVKEPEVVPFVSEAPLEEPTFRELIEEHLIVAEPAGEEFEIAEVHPEVTVEPSPEATPLPKAIRFITLTRLRSASSFTPRSSHGA
jgi:hypothetical protein